MRIEDPEDVKRFHEYLENPSPISAKAKELFKQAWRLAHPQKFDPPV